MRASQTSLVLAALFLTPAAALAQAPGPLPVAPLAAASPSGIAPTEAEQNEARARFQRALELADDGDFDAALQELRRAYSLAPSYRLLYNTGLVCQQLKLYAAAYEAFERYLREGGAEVPASRAEDVKQRLQRLAERVAYVTVRTTEPGAEVFIDDVPVGRTPLSGPVRVSSGQRRITVRPPGHPEQTRALDFAGGERKEAAFDSRVASAPPPPPGSVVPWISWGVTLSLGAAAAVTGVLAMNQASSYDNQANSQPAQDLGPAWQKLHTLSLTTDILLGATLVAAGVSTYFTIRPTRAAGSGSEATAIVVTPAGVAGVF